MAPRAVTPTNAGQATAPATPSTPSTAQRNMMSPAVTPSHPRIAVMSASASAQSAASTVLFAAPAASGPSAEPDGNNNTNIIHEHLMSTNAITYLGKTLQPDDYRWFLFRKERILLTEAQALQADADKFAHDNGGKTMQRPRGAPLAIVCVISDDSFFMDPATCWNPDFTKGKLGRQFASHKLTAMGEGTSNNVFANEWDLSIAGIRKLMDTYPKQVGVERSGLLEVYDGRTMIRFRHALFAERSYLKQDDIDFVEGCVPYNAWVYNEDSAFATELDKIKNTHVPIPLPAYDAENNILLPSQYRSSLQGATVSITFMLSVWRIGGSTKRDVFTAEIDNITVIAPPTSRKPVMPSLKRSAGSLGHNPYAFPPRTKRIHTSEDKDAQKKKQNDVFE